MRACVDKSFCIGCGLCPAISPEVFYMDSDGRANAIDEELSNSNIDSAQEAAAQCPVEAIIIE